MGLLELSEKDLFSSKRLEDETQTQYKARRRTINLARKTYIKSKLSHDTFKLMDYVKAIIANLKVEY